MVSRGVSAGTVASSLLVATINIGLLLLLSGLALSHLHGEYLFHMQVPFLDGRPFDPSVLRLLLGTALGAYFGHPNMVNAASLILRRDPSARGLIWGSAAAVVVSMGIYSLWVLAVNGTVPPAQLLGQSGTVLGPLATQIGPMVHVLGVILAVILFGTSSVRASFIISNLVRERLPVRSRTVVTLPRRRHRVLLQPRSGAAVGVRLRVSTGMQLTHAGGWDTVGLSPSDVLTLLEAQRQLVNWMLRQGEVSLAQVAAHRKLGHSPVAFRRQGNGPWAERPSSSRETMLMHVVYGRMPLCNGLYA